MRTRAPWLMAGRSGLAVLAVLCVLPVAVLLPAALANPDVAASALSARRMGLLATSIRLASLVLLVDTVVAGAAALWVSVAPRKLATAAAGVALVAAFVPPVAHAAAWSAVSEWIRSGLGLAVTPLTGLAGAVLAQSTAYLPLALVVALAGVLAADPGLVDAARVMRPDRRALARVVLPLAAAAMLAGGGIAALLSLGDEAVPAAFGVDTAAMELFASYSADGNAGATLALAWPLALVCGAAALACAVPLRSVSVRRARGRRAWATKARLGATARAPLVAGIAAAAGASVAVFGALVGGSGPPDSAIRAVEAALPDIGTTVAVALACGAVAFPVALLAGSPRAPRVGPSRWVWAIALVAAVVPAPVVGAGLVALLNRAATAAVFDSPVMLVLAGVARFAPLAAIVVAAASARLDGGPLEAALVSRPPRSAYVRVLLPQLARAAGAGGLVVAAFAAGELGATLMVVPPGTSTAVVRAFNLLHYGASSDVAAIALAVAGIGVVAAGGAWASGRRVLTR